MYGMNFNQDQNRSLIRGRYNYENIPTSMYYSSINLTPHQPPLLPLPLPLSKPHLSAQPKKPTRPTSSDQSLFPSPMKTKPAPSSQSQRAKRMGRRVSESFIVRSASVGASSGDMDDYSGLIFSVSPDPSCLPLPRFSLLPRANAGGACKPVDAAI